MQDEMSAHLLANLSFVTDVLLRSLHVKHLHMDRMQQGLVLVTVDYSNSNTDRLVSVIVVGILMAQVLVTVDYSKCDTDGQVLVIIEVILIPQVLVTVDYSTPDSGQTTKATAP